MRRNSINLLLEVYKTRVQILTSQGNRLWTRFNYILAIELVLVGLYFGYKVVQVPIIGIILSSFWYVMSAQDVYFMREHRERVDRIERELILPMVNKDFVTLRGDIGNVRTNLLGFKVRQVPVTDFAAIFPILFLIFWIIFLLFFF